MSRNQCLVLDITMPGMSGPDLVEELKHLGWKIPVVFITAERDEKVRSQVLEARRDCMSLQAVQRHDPSCGAR